MKILWGALAVNGRGKLGGHVLSKSRSGATMRTRVTPANPQTAAQGDVRNLFAQVSRGWGGLTAAQREAFNSAVGDYARTNVFGDSYNPSGKNLYTQLNLNLLNVGEPQITAIPSTKRSLGVLLTAVHTSIADSEMDITFTTSGTVVGDAYVVLEGTPPMSAGRYNFSGKYRKFHQMAHNAAPDPIQIYADYVAKFGAPELGQKISIRAKVITVQSALASPTSSFDEIVGN